MMHHLDITSGVGTVTISGDIGAATSLTTLDINAGSGTGGISIQDVGDGDTTGVTGVATIGNL